MHSVFLSWGIAAVATAGVITRPFKWPEAVWAVAGAVLLVALGLLPVQLAQFVARALWQRRSQAQVAFCSVH